MPTHRQIFWTMLLTRAIPPHSNFFRWPLFKEIPRMCQGPNRDERHLPMQFTIPKVFMHDLNLYPQAFCYQPCPRRWPQREKPENCLHPQWRSGQVRILACVQYCTTGIAVQILVCSQEHNQICGRLVLYQMRIAPP